MDSSHGHTIGNDFLTINAVAKGSQDALKKLMDKYMPMVSRTAYRILCDRPESEDVTQEVFVKIWRNASKYDEKRCGASAWIYRITCNLCYDRLRKRRLLSLIGISPSETSYKDEPSSSSPEEDLINRERWKMICKISAGLSPKQRIIFTLRELEGLSVNEVAEITGMPANNIKSNLHLAKKRIMTELERYETE